MTTRTFDSCGIAKCHYIISCYSECCPATSSNPTVWFICDSWIGIFPIRILLYSRIRKVPKNTVIGWNIACCYKGEVHLNGALSKHNCMVHVLYSYSNLYWNYIWNSTSRLCYVAFIFIKSCWVWNEVSHWKEVKENEDNRKSFIIYIFWCMHVYTMQCNILHAHLQYIIIIPSILSLSWSLSSTTDTGTVTSDWVFDAV